MKIMISIVLLSFLSFNCFGSDFSNSELGIALDIPETWRQVPVLEVNKTSSIFEAIRKSDNSEFLTLVVLPSNTVYPNNENLLGWSEDSKAAFGTKSKNKAEIKTFQKTDWYFIVLPYNKNSLLQYSTSANGFSYTFSFLTNGKVQSEFIDEAESILNSIKLSVPQNIANVIEHFNNLKKDVNTEIMIPENYYFTDNIDDIIVSPNVAGLYQSLLSGKNADYVLISEIYHHQLFAMNVVIKMPKMDTLSALMVSRVTGFQFAKEATKYEELFLGPWAGSPDKIFLYKFRLTKGDTQTIHYIFYSSDEINTDVIKFQAPAVLENVMEPCFYRVMEGMAK